MLALVIVLALIAMFALAVDAALITRHDARIAALEARLHAIDGQGPVPDAGYVDEAAVLRERDTRLAHVRLN